MFTLKIFKNVLNASKITPMKKNRFKIPVTRYIEINDYQSINQSYDKRDYIVAEDDIIIFFEK